MTTSPPPSCLTFNDDLPSFSEDPLQASQRRFVGCNLCSYGNQTPSCVTRKRLTRIGRVHAVLRDGVPRGRHRGSHSRHSGTVEGRVLTFPCCDPLVGSQHPAAQPRTTPAPQGGWSPTSGGLLCLCLQAESVSEPDCQSFWTTTGHSPHRWSATTRPGVFALIIFIMARCS